jgi:hypothetical protein
MRAEKMGADMKALVAFVACAIVILGLTSTAFAEEKKKSRPNDGLQQGQTQKPKPFVPATNCLFRNSDGSCKGGNAR